MKFYLEMPAGLRETMRGVCVQTHIYSMPDQLYQLSQSFPKNRVNI